jgi:hypothetical protein
MACDSTLAQTVRLVSACAAEQTLIPVRKLSSGPSVLQSMCVGEMPQMFAFSSRTEV